MSRRNTNDTLSELNLTMEAALYALYDDQTIAPHGPTEQQAAPFREGDESGARQNGRPVGDGAEAQHDPDGGGSSSDGGGQARWKGEDEYPRHPYGDGYPHDSGSYPYGGSYPYPPEHYPHAYARHNGHPHYPPPHPGAYDPNYPYAPTGYPPYPPPPEGYAGHLPHAAYNPYYLHGPYEHHPPPHHPSYPHPYPSHPPPHPHASHHPGPPRGHPAGQTPQGSTSAGAPRGAHHDHGEVGNGGKGGVGGALGASDRFQRLVWSAEEDALILQSVAQMGKPKWRKIAAMLPNRSDDAVRNRWHRLREAYKTTTSSEGATAGLASSPGRTSTSSPQNANAAGGAGSVNGAADGAAADSAAAATSNASQLASERSIVYKCSRCGLPKKAHVCLAPENPSAADQMKLKREGQLQLNGEGGVAGDLRSAWTRQEDEIILSSVLEFGPKWVEIAARLPGRTEHAARNRYHRLTTRGAAVVDLGQPMM